MKAITVIIRTTTGEIPLIGPLPDQETLSGEIVSVEFSEPHEFPNVPLFDIEAMNYQNHTEH